MRRRICLTSRAVAASCRVNFVCRVNDGTRSGEGPGRGALPLCVRKPKRQVNFHEPCGVRRPLGQGEDRNKRGPCVGREP